MVLLSLCMGTNKKHKDNAMIKLTIFLLATLAFSQTTEPVIGTVTIPGGTFEPPLTFHPPLSQTGGDVFCNGCGGSGGGGTIGPPSQSAVNLYISPAGSDSAACSPADPCKTLAHAFSLVPAFVSQPYQINVADGTYNEPIDGRGYFGGRLSLVGDVANPSNVSFTGALTGCEAPRFPSYTTGACLKSGTEWLLSGITVAATMRTGITCDACIAALSGIGVSGSSMVAGIQNEHGYLFLKGNNTITGFAGAGALIPNEAFGIYNLGGHTIQQGGNLTITGPGWADGLLSYGIVEEYESSWALVPECDTCSTPINTNISNVYHGIELSSNASYVSFGQFPSGVGTITISNATNSGGHGLDLYNEAEFDLIGGSTGVGLVINNFGACISSQQWSTMSDGPGNRSLTNCTATTGGQIVLF